MSNGKKTAQSGLTTAEETYKALQSRIAALESSNAAEEESARKDEKAARERLAMSISNSAGGSVVHTNGDVAVTGEGGESDLERKYIELFKEMKRNEREWNKEKKRLLKDKELVKSDLTKSNVARTKLEKLSRELTKENKRLTSLSTSEQYEMREKYYECVLRAKDLEVLLERARADKWRKRVTELENTFLIEEQRWDELESEDPETQDIERNEENP